MITKIRNIYDKHPVIFDYTRAYIGIAILDFIGIFGPNWGVRL